MPNRGVSGTAELDAGIGLGILNKGSQIGNTVALGPLGVDGQSRSVGVDTADQVIVLIAQVGAEGGIGAQLKGNHTDVVAVLVRIGNRLVADDAAAASQVINRHVDTKLFTHSLAESTQAGVRAAAGTPGANNVDILGGIIAGRSSGFLGGSSSFFSRSGFLFCRSGRAASGQCQNHQHGQGQSQKFLCSFHFSIPSFFHLSLKHRETMVIITKSKGKVKSCFGGILLIIIKKSSKTAIFRFKSETGFLFL